MGSIIGGAKETAEMRRAREQQEKLMKQQQVELARERDQEQQERTNFRRRLRGVFSLLGDGGFRGFGNKEKLG